MRKTILLMIISIALLVSIVGMVLATSEYVIFNGQWGNGTTLFSNMSYFVQVNFTGKDAYPIRENCTTETVCRSWNYYYNKTCLKYSTRTTNRDGTPRCIKWKREKIITDCKRYRDITRCSRIQNSKIICYNPNGEKTNQLRLENFFYTINNTIDGGTSWNAVLYTKINLTETNLTFKVDIPVNCTPTYDINKAIRIDD